MNKEQQGIYDVTFGDKEMTPIFKDIEAIEDAVIEYITMYVKGFHDKRRDKGLGAEHIKLHLDKGSQGEITLEELVNLGYSIREYLKKFENPFLEENGAKIYEWENEEHTRFRVITDIQRGGRQLPLSPSEHQIITFYSDRNLNERMEFKNPLVKEYYDNLQDENENNQSHIAKIKKRR
ncbi:hypothetical protein HW260_03135 [Helicobacter cinaedi]|uniref:Uncharacterized protein n=1 Tax=Helicobacter cinaedi CCUG 18818 = ATCC BAA-847 TaxID=537971 RepID=A0AAI8MMW6_9HELI|nr:hypothetical protein [Helicobacter cinaedi]EFR47521.1 hypothetical protein HCCG_02069 [Helicobacter cinaedi CCUG 18818 = ATCC BAA-847]QOQ91344.1 hypothetical protein HW260_03135 [Helicobacter cinaedi]BAM32645.1 conserved hypothetical protein [Helicobacter cinaedi CCUG 18818 = ATCC BAA-847]